MFEFTIPDDTVATGDDRIERQDNANEKIKQTVIRIDYDICEDSGVCTEVCPEDVLTLRGGHTRIDKPEACTECWICVENCVSGAIEIG